MITQDPQFTVYSWYCMFCGLYRVLLHLGHIRRVRPHLLDRDILGLGTRAECEQQQGQRHTNQTRLKLYEVLVSHNRLCYTYPNTPRRRFTIRSVL